MNTYCGKANRGRIYVPKKIRNQLGITSTTPLKLEMSKSNQIIISPQFPQHLQ